MNIKHRFHGRIRRPNVLPLLVLMLSMGTVLPLHAEIYKCVDNQGHASFSSIPCREDSGTTENSMTTEDNPVMQAGNTDPTILDRSAPNQSKRLTESEERELLFAVDGKIRELQKNIDKLQRERSREVAAADVPEATHSSVYRQQSEIRTRFDTVIASELDTISQLRKKRQALIEKIM